MFMLLALALFALIAGAGIVFLIATIIAGTSGTIVSGLIGFAWLSAAAVAVGVIVFVVVEISTRMRHHLAASAARIFSILPV